MIDAALYGSVLRILEWTIAAYDRLGTVRQREGNRLANSAPLDNYPTADGRYVCLVAGSDANFARLCAAMDRPDLVDDPRFAHRWPTGRPVRRDQRHRGRLDLGAAPRPRSKPRPSPTTCPWPPPTPRPTSPPTRTWRRGATSSTVDDPVLGPAAPAGAVPAVRGRGSGRSRPAPPAWASTPARCWRPAPASTTPSSTAWPPPPSSDSAGAATPADRQGTANLAQVGVGDLLAPGPW